ncbi:hypothetical protein LXG23DRAFT_26012 [Yarrowia lipolytica]|uniref:Structure-specific endonuclease subunit SLX4 n=1 Tax=Yarrowia lipolytica TaxID=4952 RepID=A0A1D8N6K2_YARLL|nr:hypothetical protein YALI1_B07220g [Yarrowia lipolytica]KAB8285347.1 hypothetical protein BKA91DRAFT_133643 [Yarrowia lipolytica]KAE8174971.1 hypothetical protein BKA90DRAFT_133236 [Yarrowia lipolytica]KAJ8052123.1 hypothetical protein LXG23DRAFT_26012 [Yarrowia lipolytica]RMJ00848.1 hypothetical protein BD777DRAFT_121388 [Yarrowia lipolytica]
MPLDDLEAPEFTEPEPGLSREEDEEMFRARAQRLDRFVHGVIQSRSTLPKAPASEGNPLGRPSHTMRHVGSSSITVQTEKDATKPTTKRKKPRKARDSSITKKTKTSRRKKVPLDQVPNTVMPAMRAVSLTQRVELVGPKVANYKRNSDYMDTNVHPRAIKEMMKSRDEKKATNPTNLEPNTPHSLMGLTRSIPSDLGLEEVFQLHDVSYQERDLASDSDLSESCFKVEGDAHVGPHALVCFSDTGDDEISFSGSSELRGKWELDEDQIESVNTEDKSVQITNVKSLPEVIYMGEDTSAERVFKPSTGAVGVSLNSRVLASDSQQDCSFSPPPTFNYNNYKSFFTVAESSVAHVSDSECDSTQSHDSTRYGRPRNEYDREIIIRIESSSPESASKADRNATDIYDRVSHEATPVRSTKVQGRSKRPHVDDEGALIPRMINTQSGPTHIYRMCSSDSEEVDSWTPGKSSGLQTRNINPRENEASRHPHASSSSPMAGHSTPKAQESHSPPHEDASSSEEVLSSGDSSIISMRVGTGKSIHGPSPNTHSRSFSTTRKTVEENTASNASAQRADSRRRSEIDLTGLSSVMDNSNVSEHFVPESPEAALDQLHLMPDLCEINRHNIATSPCGVGLQAGLIKRSGDLPDGEEEDSVIILGTPGKVIGDDISDSTLSEPSGSRQQKRSAPKKTLARSSEKRRAEERTGDDNSKAPPSTQATASIAGQMIEKGEVDKMKMSELTEFMMSAPEARDMWLKMLTYQPISLSQLMEFNKEHGIKISKVLTIAWCDLHGVTWTSREEEKETAKESNSD